MAIRQDEDAGGDVAVLRSTVGNPSSPNQASHVQLFYKWGTGWCYRAPGGTVYKLKDMSSDDPLYIGDATTPPLLKFDSTRNVVTLDGKGFAIDLRGNKMAKDRYSLYTAFEKLPQLNAVASPPAANTYNTATMLAALQASQDFEVLGTNAASTDVTKYAEGGIAVATHGATNDSTIILPHLTAGFSPWKTVTWGSDQGLRWECAFRTPAAVTSLAIWAGLKLTNTPTVATDLDQVFFEFNTGASADATKWHTIYSINDTDVDAGVGSAVTADTDYHLVIEIDSNRVPRFYINGTLVTTGTALTDAKDFIPYIGIKDLSAGSARTMYVWAQAIGRDSGV